jgi:two-component system response regulator YesN
MPVISGLELICEVRKLDSDTEFVILSGYADFAYAKEAMRYNVSDYLLKPLEKDEIISVLRKIKNKMDAKFLTMYGFSQTDIETFKTSRRLASENTKNDFLNDEAEGTWWRSLRENFEEELIAAIKLMNYDDAMKLIDELFDWFKAKDISCTNACIMVNSCVYHILYIAYERNIKVNTVLPSDSSSKWDFVNLKNYITNIVLQISSLMLEERKKNSRSYLYEVKTYIEKNYEKELSVSYLADMVFLEAGYLGDAFNKLFGCSINEYQHRLRIGKAIELIETTDMKLSEISATVGYNNYNNFYSHFGRITHIKPTQYGRK